MTPQAPTPFPRSSRVALALAALLLGIGPLVSRPAEAQPGPAGPATEASSASKKPAAKAPSQKASSSKASQKASPAKVSAPKTASPKAAAPRIAAPKAAPSKASASKKAAVGATAAAATARAASAGPGEYATRSDVADFVHQMVDRHGFDPRVLASAFAQARRDDSVLRLIAPAPAGFKRSWEAYRNRFLDPLRVREGLRFWQENEAALRRAEATWQVPPEIIVAIIGVETIYGRVTGDFRVFDALTTLAFDYPRRSEYFRQELEQFLLYSREQGFALDAPRGSFAGAIGLPQFMPGSIRRYAVDFDGNGRIDLSGSPIDAIGSVANFLAQHGWIGGEPTHFLTRIEDLGRIEPLIAAGIEPRFTIDELAGYGVSSPQTIPPGMPLALIDLPNGDQPTSYYLGPRNFYVITRYNRSSFYAMAVIELSRVLAAAR